MFSDEEYVDWEKVFNEKLKSKNIPTERIFFDPKLLANVMSCVDSTFVRMTHKGGDHDSAFHITFSDLESEAVLMGAFDDKY